jgi:hypothetical protein
MNFRQEVVLRHLLRSELTLAGTTGNKPLLRVVASVSDRRNLLDSSSPPETTATMRNIMKTL